MHKHTHTQLGTHAGSHTVFTLPRGSSATYVGALRASPQHKHRHTHSHSNTLKLKHTQACPCKETAAPPSRGASLPSAHTASTSEAAAAAATVALTSQAANATKTLVWGLSVRCHWLLLIEKQMDLWVLAVRVWVWVAAGEMM